MYNYQQVQNNTIQSPCLNNNSPQFHSQNYIAKNTSFLTQLSGLHYFESLKSYWTSINDENLIRYRPQYRKMFANQYMWYQFLKKRNGFSVFRQIIIAEKGPLIFVALMSVLMGLISLFGAFSLKFLFLEHTDKTFHTSGWVFFGIIMAAMTIRFFIFNYLQRIANQVAVNTRIHLQNSYIRCMMEIPRSQQNQAKSLLYFNFFASIEVIVLALKTMPYFVSSTVIVFGIVGFVINIVGVLGLILLGITLIAFIIDLILLFYMFHVHEHYAEASNVRNSYSIFSTQFLIKLVQKGLNSKFLKKILKLRKNQTNFDIKYTILDGFIQIFAQCAALLTVFIFYLIEENHGIPSYNQIFQCVVLFSIFKTPVKMMAYGLAFTMQLYGSAKVLQEMFLACKPQNKIQKRMSFPRQYPHKTKLWQQQQFQTIQLQRQASITLETPHEFQKYSGQLVAIVNSFSSNDKWKHYILELSQKLSAGNNCTIISKSTLMVNDSLRRNILFGKKYHKERFDQVLEVVQLKDVIQKLPEKDQNQLDVNWIQSSGQNSILIKIKLARALYSQVGILVIDHFVRENFSSVLNNIKRYRNNPENVTILINSSEYLCEISDSIIQMDQNGNINQLKYSQFIQSSQVSKDLRNTLQKQKLQNSQPVNDKQLELLFPKKIDYEEQVNAGYKNIFKFYNYNHFGAGIVLLILLCIPPLIDLYMEAIVAESKDFFNTQHKQTEDDIHVQQHRITLRYGISLLVFFFFNSLKVIVLSVYLRKAAYKIFRDIMKRFTSSTIEATLLTDHKTSGLDLQRNLQSIDIRTTTQLDIGLTIIYEHIAIIVFASISSILFLAVGIPFLVINILILIIVIKYSRKVFHARRPARSKLNTFVKDLIRSRESISMKSQKQFVFEKFVELNKNDILYELNQDWLLQALSILFQFIIILMLMTVLIISLTEFQYIHQQQEAFLELAISFVLGLANSGRMDLKVFKAVDRQVVGVSSLFKIAQHYNRQSNNQSQTNIQIDQIESIQLKDVTVQFQPYYQTQLNLNIQSGQRIILTSKTDQTLKLLPQLMLKGFDKEHIKGEVRINGIDVYSQNIPQHHIQQLIYVLSEKTQIYFGQTILQHVQHLYPQLREQLISQTLMKIFTVVDTQMLFDIQTKINSLSNINFQMLQLINAVLTKAEVLIVSDGLKSFDFKTKSRIVKWLIQKSYFKIILDISNQSALIPFYPKHIHFQNKVVRKQAV